MALVKADLIEELWARLGKPRRTGEGGAVEIDNTDMGNALEEALADVSSKIPKKSLVYITTVADQQEYDPPTGVIGVIEALDEDVGEPTAVSFDSDIPCAVKDTYGGMSIYDNPSLADIRTMKEKSLANAYQQEIDYKDEGKIWISPAPEEAGDKIYFIGKILWTWADVPVRFKKAILIYGRIISLQILEERRNRLSGVPRSGGSIDYGAGVPLQKASSEAHLDYDREIDYQSKLNMLG